MKSHIKDNGNGFTLAELLIVVAIIAVLVSIAVPVFSKSLEKAKQAVFLTNARTAMEAAQYIAIEELAQGTSFNTWRGFSTITDKNPDIQNRIYELSGIDKNEYTIANVDINSNGKLIFINLYSKKRFNGDYNRVVYMNGTIGGKTYNSEFIISCWNGEEYYPYKLLDPGQVGYKEE